MRRNSESSSGLASSSSNLSTASSGSSVCLNSDLSCLTYSKRTTSLHQFGLNATNKSGLGTGEKAAAAARLAEVGALVAASWASSWDRDLLWSALSSTNSLGCSGGQREQKFRQSLKSLEGAEAEVEADLASKKAGSKAAGEDFKPNARQCMKTSVTLEDFREPSKQPLSQFCTKACKQRPQATTHTDEWPLHDSKAVIPK